MRFRFTIAELEQFSDRHMLQALINERLSNVTNDLAPLARRLKALHDKLQYRKQLTTIDLDDLEGADGRMLSDEMLTMLRHLKKTHGGTFTALQAYEVFDHMDDVSVIDVLSGVVDDPTKLQTHPISAEKHRIISKLAEDFKHLAKNSLQPTVTLGDIV